MPLYEYRCSDCGNEFEMRMRYSEADRHPECSARIPSIEGILAFITLE